MLPSAEALHLRRVRRNLFGVLPEQDLEGNRNPQGGAAEAEAEERVAAGRMTSPEAVTETKAGYRTADTCRSKVFIGILVEEVRRHYSFLSGVKSSARRVQSYTAVAQPTARVRPPHHTRRPVVRSKRIGSKNGHRIVFGESVRS